jgi:hypothetical protein
MKARRSDATNSGRTLFCLAFHAERLESDRIWQEVTSLVRKCNAWHLPLTFFVAPFLAIESGTQIQERLRWLLTRRCEIGQHTHFYGDFRLTSQGQTIKRTSLERHVVHRCLERDLQYLVSAGARPQGFTAGGWAFNATVLAWLAARGFQYDCTPRTFRLSFEDKLISPGGHWTSAVHENNVLRLPTTADLVRFYKRGLRGTGLRIGEITYDLVVLHDHDLLARRKRWLVHALPGLLDGRVQWKTAHQLSALVSHELSRRHLT